MKKEPLKIIFFISLISFFTACNSVKRIADDEHLLIENTVIINGDKDKSEFINNLLYQKPNSKIPLLGTPLRLHIYNLARPNLDSLLKANLYSEEKKNNWLENFLSKKQLDKYIASRVGFNQWLKNTGEAPVIVSEEKTKRSVSRLNAYHINNGWFDVDTNYEINKKDNKRATITYKVETGVPFKIDSISERITSPVIDSLYGKIKKSSLIQSGDQYRTAIFNNERDRISTELRNSGLFHFNQEYVSFEMDTIGNDKKVDVALQIQDRAIRTPDSIRREPFQIYTIKDVNIITDYTFENRGKPFQDSIIYDNYKLLSYNKMRYRPKALTDAVFITPGRIFRDIDRTRTYRYINDLRTFKYPNIDYYENSDYTLTDTIRLTPLKKFSLGFSAEASQSNIQRVGFALNPSLQIRNVFRGAETFQISAIGSIGSSKDKNNENDPFFDINEVGLDLKLTIPRLFSPVNTEKIIPKYMSPSTRIGLAATSQTNIGLDKQTFTGTFNYNWFPNKKITNRLDLFNIQYVRNLNIENYFRIYESSYNILNQVAKDVNYINEDTDLLIPNETSEFLQYVLNNPRPAEVNDDQLIVVNTIDERKQRLTENNLILSSSFSLINDERTNLFDDDFSIFRVKLELAGNLLATTSSLLGLEKDQDGRYELFNVAYSQYVKTELDYIKHFDLGKKNILAMRSFLGIAIPYENSTNIPFSKSFFAGGPNDNRAWSAYNLGPGSSETLNEFNEANLKLALSVEQRFNIFADLNGALFIDAGNIWNVLDDVENDNARFSDFGSLKDIAIGSGFGLRYDFGFFVFRFDVGFKTYDPSYQDENRWFNDYNFGNAVYNIGINYPF
ncbi:translocation and assembly module lipoprotein TamL [Changchengzhania lutea]|uniref:translocation and assembly module lipoprotein TamL n=1 Tax=Changchengzhania lutea TaxID=2049305 RepID=UPI00115F4797|nr:BamA/TamA family outer membrane protein [Changchengzhania lutea]